MLAEHGDEARVLAGGQSLIPALNFRLAEPAVLIDLHRLPELNELAFSRQEVRLGAMCTQHRVERHAQTPRHVPLLALALPHVAHVPIRTRGTIGGSLAHNDPAAELPAVMLALEAVYQARSTRGIRRIPAAEFSAGLFATALEPDEILESIHLPPAPEHRRLGYGFQEFARRHGDFALAGAAAVMGSAAGETCDVCRLVWFGLGDGPVRATDLPLGQAPDFRALEEVLADQLTQTDVVSDMHASTAYRRHLAVALGLKALRQAWSQVVRDPAVTGRDA